jgi:sRNA-binding protein
VSAGARRVRYLRSASVLAVLCQAIAKGVITAIDIRRALARYVASDGYQSNMRTGTGRLDLGGNMVGVVTPAEAKHARQFLSERCCKKPAAHATATCRRTDTGDSAIRTETKRPRRTVTCVRGRRSSFAP